jgi:AcrR family transcriptional regulator
MVAEATHLRADARRNLERILDAAHTVFAEEGLEASVADVAERAGVGTATIFRRFPTKDDLVAAMLEQELEAVVARARAAAEAEDSAAALADFFSAVVERFIGDRCFCEASGGDLFERPRMQELVGELTAAVEGLLRRARKDATIRRDVVPEDIGFLVNAIGLAGLRLEHTAPGAWRRYVEIVLAGLAPQGGRKLTHKPPTPQQLHAAKRGAIKG